MDKAREENRSQEDCAIYIYLSGELGVQGFRGSGVAVVCELEQMTKKSNFEQLYA